MDQITQTNSELVDVLKEIGAIDKIRVRLQKHFEQRSIEEARLMARRVRERLSAKFVGGFRLVDDFAVSQAVEELVLELYPTETYSIEQAKAEREISKEIATMYEKYQKIIKGTTINIEFQSKHYDKVMGIIFQCCCNACQLKVSDKLAKDAHSLTEKRTITL